MIPSSRDQLLQHLADLITRIERPHPIRVAIDGVDGAGKTMLADELVRHFEHRGRHVIRASIDGFHRPRAERYRRGSDSPEGFYHGSFDHAALRADLLEPCGPGGLRRYRHAVFDWRADAPVDAPPDEAPADAVLLFDGIFCQRPELIDHWDLRIFLDVPFEETWRRMAVRDLTPTSSLEEMERRFRTRYAPGQQLYLATAQPRERAHIVIDNTDPCHPLMIRDHDPEP
ncbi:MAG: Uridine kinase [uncultured Chloroflexi bacterium]|uniref:Uridine kinase n=1 Tax=uncultured Chloroflexota bacterium TaxID=166587 RepID=A0A6J4JY73_9CHLR|nr:MAG: Uridine kinase [uncultured Chloroflexota bacterium]